MSKALPLKIIAITCILVTSVIGVGLPLVSRSIPTLRPDQNLFVIVKCFAAGIILGTGFMHVLPDSFDMLGSPCLPDQPWHNFSFTGYVAMFSAVITLMVDSMATSVYTKKNSVGVISGDNQEMAVPIRGGGHFHCHHDGSHQSGAKGGQDSQLLRYKVVAMVLELGIIVHSVVIGLSMGASNNTCTIMPLVAALCFHQMFEGMGLGGCILQAYYKLVKKLAITFFFAVTTSFGIALGDWVVNNLQGNSPTALVIVGLLNAPSVGLLIYKALVDLLAADFMGPKLQGSIELQVKSFIAVMLGADGTALMDRRA